MNNDLVSLLLSVGIYVIIAVDHYVIISYFVLGTIMSCFTSEVMRDTMNPLCVCYGKFNKPGGRDQWLVRINNARSE